MRPSHRFLAGPFLAVLAILGAAACGSNSGSPLAPEPVGPAAAPAAGATVEGTVESGAAGSSSFVRSSGKVANIRVTAVGTGISTTTDSSGRFVLSNLPSGSVTLRFEGPGISGSIEISGLAAGQVVRIQVRVSGSTVELAGGDDDDEDEVEFDGTIDSIGASSLVVSGRTVLVDDQTKIQDHDKNTIALTDLQVGDSVEVEGVGQSDGSVLARKIKLEDDEDEDEVEFDGTIDSIGSSSLVVSGITVLTDERTELKGEGRTHSLADFSVGDQVEVEGLRNADGSVLAREIKRLDRAGDDDDDDDDDDDEDEDDDGD